MQDDNRETEIEIKVLSSFDKEEIFMMRWFTLIIISLIVLVLGTLFLNLNGYIGIAAFAGVWIVPPFFYFRKSIKKWVNEKVNYWWSMINGRIP